ncbi:MAG: FHA domain-containing protein [Armatimonadetes bacterium]|nr:FHA domain-containing protein [Armatimonadota bacterium]
MMKATIEILSGPQDGKEILIADIANIGRDEQNEVSLPTDRYVSRRHAVVRREEGQYVLEDLGSTNGSFVDDRRVTGLISISNGQVFKIGRTLLRILYR